MEQYWVEGLYLPKLKRTSKAAKKLPVEVEPFARIFWSESASDAERQATEGSAWRQMGGRAASEPYHRGAAHAGNGCAGTTILYDGC